MPTENRSEGFEPGHRQRRCMHVVLIALLEMKGRKILFYRRQIIDLTIRIQRAVGIGVDEVGQSEVIAQSYPPGVGDVTTDEPFPSCSAQVKGSDGGAAHNG